MTALTLEALRTELDKKFAPVQTSLVQVESRLDSQEGQLSTLSKRLDKVEKIKNLPAKSIEKSKTPAKKPETITPGGMAWNRVVTLSPPVRDREGLTAAIEAEEKKKEEPVYKQPRHRDMDYSNRMAATGEQRMKYDEDWAFGYLCLGLNPNGTATDRERARDEIMEKNGGQEPAEKEIEWHMIKEYLQKDMGMDEIAVTRVREETERWFFEGDTSFLKFYSRDGVAIVYSWANMMNRMAYERNVTRKLHVWCPPQLESRFFALKNLEWTYRNYMKKKAGRCMTRIYYRESTIFAQYKTKYEDEFADIYEVPSAKIPTVEFWRVTAHPRLNSRSRGRGRGIPRPAADAPVPEGRVRPDEHENRGRGRGRSRGMRGNRGVAMGYGLRQIEHVGRGGHGESSSSGQQRGGSNARGGLNRDDAEPEGGATAMDGVETGVGNLNSKAVSREASQVLRELPGNSAVENKAGYKKRRGGKGRTYSSSQTNTLHSYQGYVKEGTDRKRSRSQDDVDDEKSSKRKIEEEPTKIRAERPSPTKKELETYISVAKKLHKSGALELVEGTAGTLGQARMVEKLKFAGILEKEKMYYKNLKERIEGGEKDYGKTELHVDTAVFTAEKRKCLKRLSDLNDHTLETVAVDKSLETTIGDSDTDTAFTETETETETEVETETEKENEDEDGLELEALEIEFE